MPTTIATVRHLQPRAVPTTFSVIGAPLLIWAMALMLVSAIAHFNPPIHALDTFDLIAAF